jgi:methyl-accepting chemotaxis protein
MTQQNAALVEQSTAAAESLKHQASRLGELVATFRLQRA